ncbi:MAG: hypothetical protein LBS83_02205 [Holosporales bacterium]|nr:hypothetical protein [Holosporales bacterium]
MTNFKKIFEIKKSVIAMLCAAFAVFNLALPHMYCSCSEPPSIVEAAAQQISIPEEEALKLAWAGFAEDAGNVLVVPWSRGIVAYASGIVPVVLRQFLMKNLSKFGKFPYIRTGLDLIALAVDENEKGPICTELPVLLDKVSKNYDYNFSSDELALIEKALKGVWNILTKIEELIVVDVKARPYDKGFFKGSKVPISVVDGFVENPTALMNKERIQKAKNIIEKLLGHVGVLRSSQAPKMVKEVMHDLAICLPFVFVWNCKPIFDIQLCNIFSSEDVPWMLLPTDDLKDLRLLMGSATHTEVQVIVEQFYTKDSLIRKVVFSSKLPCWNCATMIAFCKSNLFDGCRFVALNWGMGAKEVYYSIWPISFGDKAISFSGKMAIATKNSMSINTLFPVMLAPPENLADLFTKISSEINEALKGKGKDLITRTIPFRYSDELMKFLQEYCIHELTLSGASLETRYEITSDNLKADNDTFSGRIVRVGRDYRVHRVCGRGDCGYDATGVRRDEFADRLIERILNPRIRDGLIALINTQLTAGQLPRVFVRSIGGDRILELIGMDGNNRLKTLRKLLNNDALVVFIRNFIGTPAQNYEGIRVIDGNLIPGGDNWMNAAVLPLMAEVMNMMITVVDINGGITGIYGDPSTRHAIVRNRDGIHFDRLEPEPVVPVV